MCSTEFNKMLMNSSVWFGLAMKKAAMLLCHMVQFQGNAFVTRMLQGNPLSNLYISR